MHEGAPRDLSELNRFSMVSYFIITACSTHISRVSFCSWGKRSCTSHKSKGLCFVFLGTADLLWRIKDPEGPAENKQLTCRGHKVYFAISFSMPHFSIRANAFHHGLNISLEPARYPTRWCPSANREQHIPHKQKRRQCRYCIQ